VHGGLGPELTWERQRSLGERWDLVVPTRRGFPGGPDGPRQDFDRDAEDLSRLVGDGAHLVGFSYGGLGSSVLAGREPGRVRSLTLVEVPLYLVAPDDPDIEELARAGDAFLEGDADPEAEVEFLANAGLGPDAPSEHAEEIERATEAARGGRSPREASPDLDAIVEAGIPVLVVSGEHHRGIETLCDALAERLQARRETLPGAGHAVPRAPGFNELLEDFLRSAETE
jgi:pimeloyl-ACP methyl ester carboxylesterase